MSINDGAGRAAPRREGASVYERVVGEPDAVIFEDEGGDIDERLSNLPDEDDGD